MITGMQALADERLYYRYLHSLDAREVLVHYGAEHVTEQPGEDGTTELVHSCLIDRVEPHHRNRDANPSASVNVEKRKFICYASQWRGDLFHLVMKMEGKESFSEALLAVSDLIHAGPTTTRRSKTSWCAPWPRRAPTRWPRRPTGSRSSIPGSSGRCRIPT